MSETRSERAVQPEWVVALTEPELVALAAAATGVLHRLPIAAISSQPAVTLREALWKVQGALVRVADARHAAAASTPARRGRA